MERHFYFFELNDVTKNISHHFSDHFEQILAEINIYYFGFLIFSFVNHDASFLNKVQLIFVEEFLLNGGLFQKYKLNWIITEFFLQFKSHFFKVLLSKFLVFNYNDTEFLVITVTISFLIVIVSYYLKIVFLVFFVDDCSQKLSYFMWTHFAIVFRG